MAQRSYLMVAAEDGHRAVLEAANNIPLLWLALIDAATPDADWSAGATLRLTDAASTGLALEREAALRRLAARRAGVVAWVGEAAGVVLDQFADFIATQPGLATPAALATQAGPTKQPDAALRLDVSEWVDLFDSREQALQDLRAGVAALDSKVGKRRPPAVKKLMDGLSLSGREAEDPAFGALLAGVACSGREPWRRDPPRERRKADDYITWVRKADRHFIAADGRRVATTVTNSDGVETPVMWSTGSSDLVTHASEVPDEVGHLDPQCLSADGESLFCGARWHPGAVPRTLRVGPDGVRVIHEGEPAFAVSACSTAGDVAAGTLFPADGGPSLAALWRDGSGLQALPDVPPDSQVWLASADGKMLAGASRLKDATGESGDERLWTWRGDGTGVREVAQDWRAEWRALSRDGRRGVLQLRAGREAPTRLLLWDAAADAPRPIECGAVARSEVVFSNDLGCALARTADAMQLWWADGRGVETTLATEGLMMDPLHVSSAGDWWVATLRNTANYAAAAVLLWERGRGLRRFDAPPSDGRLQLGLSVASACESLDELVLFGQWRDTGEPVTWSLQRGFLEWGAAPPPVPEPPIDFTPLAQAPDFAYVEMPRRQRPMREIVQEFRAAFPGLRTALYFTAPWCETCHELEPLLRRPALQALLRGVLLMRVDVDRVGNGSRSIAFEAESLPTFVVLDDAGVATDRVIDAGAWDETTEENVAAALRSWLSRGGA
jgi:hypothetical protein